MTSWMKERDRLVEQTLAFVKGVAAQQPVKIVAIGVDPPAAVTAGLDHKPGVRASSAETDALISLMTLSQSPPHRDQPIMPPEPIVVSEPPFTMRTTAKPPMHMPAARRPVEIVLPEREAIAQRVARFRAGQQKLIQEREDYYETVRAKIRETLDNDPFA